MEISECITIHLGSENSRIIYGRMLNFLEEHGVEIISECEITEITADDFNNKIQNMFLDDDDLLFKEAISQMVQTIHYMDIF